MKNSTILLLLLLCNHVIAQDVIQTKAGNKIEATEGSIWIDSKNKHVLYKLPNVKKRKKIKFKDVVSASYKDHQFQTFDVNGKSKGFLILVDANDKRLGAISTNRTVSKGGFEVPYMRYELAVIDNSGKVLQYLVFTDVNNPNNIAMRKVAGEIVRNNFQDCPNLLERLKTFENTDLKSVNGDIAELIAELYLISCK